MSNVKSKHNGDLNFYIITTKIGNVFDYAVIKKNKAIST